MELTLTPLLIFGLATWRLSSLLVNEAGPWDVALKLRESVGITHDENKNKVIIPDGFFGGFFSCIWCCSLWVGPYWIGFYMLVPEATLWIASAFAVSALAILVQNCTER